ncbi:deoxyribose-phosphate aldolase [Cytobacillus horneckiae]|uniref:Deoxyribose-phosphate aldolase n=1 Tax=Cytobacillus horneckiae TaxID=549687 RepID=A0A2N0ZBD3_9BACI|nr:deoxyribose-phosphate aldolase [Cytobacillus horneckiae]MBN6886403.1 deoxyribose-phosphate aldolase [Cytobacillus horneckiae]MCM3176646.1 deoxyribose-phosphate aldolase [Cytobacillus horneckiae]MEC1158519.1 deoxyribose-phosphate aldolase [Cytobacillus horneckiae]MED2939622.1 deoxyribose-phosphate aldolase [Cytobacillus horneckiae]PKG26799.1 deoxyribose-phosphate aldolase [Cytobacillus horneckiae]
MELTKLIDHTLLSQITKEKEMIKLCDEAKQYGFASVCVNPTWVRLSAKQLQSSGVNVCTVIGFPLGANTPETKAFETKNAIENGAVEVDTVINIGALRDRNDLLVEQDIRSVVEAAKGKALVKVIIETSLLTEGEKIRACELSVKAGADFVKTSTGFSLYGATVEDVALMRKTVGESVGVKASGGVRNVADIKAMIEAGASRIGTSSAVKIFKNNGNATTY